MRVVLSIVVVVLAALLVWWLLSAEAGHGRHETVTPRRAPARDAGAAEPAPRGPALGAREADDDELEWDPPWDAPSEGPLPAPPPAPVRPRPAEPPRPPRETATPEPEREEGEAPPPLIWSLGEDGITSAMDGVRADVAECYEAWLRGRPDLEGRLLVELRVEARTDDPELGSVVAVHVLESEIEHGLLEGCVLNALVGLRFAAPEEPLTIRYPFELRADPVENGTL